MKRQATVTISVDDVMEYFECSEQEANRIWDIVDDETGIEDALNDAATEQFVILMYEYKRRNNNA